jgi:ornithine cyclodeaminase/alanine dehydrogenase-like protein (mu-crystallin family)
MLILNGHEVEQLLDMPGCMAAMEETLVALARGDFVLPLRPIVRAPEANHLLGLMPTYRGGERPLYALKTVAVFPDNSARGLDPHQGTVTLYSGETGEVLAVMNASPITAIRTAAVSGVATRVLARPDSTVLAIVGAGHQAHPHIAAMLEAAQFEDIRISSRSRESAERLAADWPLARAVGSNEEAVRDADVICTVTQSADPVLEYGWLKPGAHINAVGACFPHARELDSETVARSAFFTDRRESCVNEAGDYVIALAEGAIADGHIRAELGEVLAGSAPGRESDDEVTVFESLGIAVEDLASAEYLMRRAQETGTGTNLEF